MDIRRTIYFGVSGLLLFLALATITYWMVSLYTASAAATRFAPYITVPMIFLFPAGVALTWFVGQSLEMNRTLRRLVWSALGLSGLVWAYLSTVFFFGPIAL